MTNREPLQISIENGLAVLTLNRPEVLNAIDVPLAQALLAAVERIETGAGVRAILLRGAGRGFCAGGDVSKFTGIDGPHAEVADRTMRHFHPAIRGLALSPVPTVAMVHGAVAGAGIGLMLACDFVVAADTARFSLAYAKIGASTDDGASWILPRLLGLRKAKELAMLSDRIDAAEALRLGLINRAVAGERLEDEAMALARRLAAGPTTAFGMIKRLMDDSFSRDLSAHLEIECEAFVKTARTADFDEGLASFFGKREPKFSGR
ncbi:MAG: enoyl-CoA hydratase/isomerase family protein [Proteobacteria bacterium]|nr:enoyl-CoA hydratase/isomerase family protein [Pseudomonadota bacterium]MBI3496090.1 enoyl-CoA hydratase/isomerase family protein [Pseudomonadota bacterium]